MHFRRATVGLGPHGDLTGGAPRLGGMMGFALGHVSSPFQQALGPARDLMPMARFIMPVLPEELSESAVGVTADDEAEPGMPKRQRRNDKLSDVCEVVRVSLQRADDQRRDARPIKDQH